MWLVPLIALCVIELNSFAYTKIFRRRKHIYFFFSLLGEGGGGGVVWKKLRSLLLKLILWNLVQSNSLKMENMEYWVFANEKNCNHTQPWKLKDFLGIGIYMVQISMGHLCWLEHTCPIRDSASSIPLPLSIYLGRKNIGVEGFSDFAKKVGKQVVHMEFFSFFFNQRKV